MGATGQPGSYLANEVIPEEPMSALDKNVLKNLIDYRGMSLVRMAGINVLMSMLQKKDIGTGHLTTAYERVPLCHGNARGETRTSCIAIRLERVE